MGLKSSVKERATAIICNYNYGCCSFHFHITSFQCFRSLNLSFPCFVNYVTPNPINAIFPPLVCNVVYPSFVLVWVCLLLNTLEPNFAFSTLYICPVKKTMLSNSLINCQYIIIYENINNRSLLGYYPCVKLHVTFP